MFVWHFIERACVFMIGLMSFLCDLSTFVILLVVFIYWARGGFKTK